MKRTIVKLGGLSVLLLAAGSCGGGSGSGGSWLTFSPESISVITRLGETMPFSVVASSTRTFTQAPNVAIIDPDGVTNGDVDIEAESARSYTITFHVNASLAPGTHAGHLGVRLCLDEPLTCASPVDGSPWYIAYTILVIDPASYSFSAWEKASDAPFTDDYALSARGSGLVAVAAGFYTGVMETWASDEIGSTWRRLEVSGPTKLTRNFALATDGSTVYLSGGEEMLDPRTPLGTYANHVWSFDGGWHEQTAAAPFAGRQGHSMVALGGALYVFGGSNAGGDVSDAWRSTDGGRTWVELTALPSGAGGGNCAATWGDEIALVRSGRLWTSSDGGHSWMAQPGYAYPFTVGGTHCAEMGGRLYLYGLGGGPAGGGGMVSSADLQSWVFEPMTSYGEAAPGLIPVNGRLFVALGMDSSYRPIMRTVPR